MPIEDVQNLPDSVDGRSGLLHNDDHEAIHPALKMIDWVAMQSGSLGHVLKQQADGRYAPDVDLQGGGGFGASVGIAFADSQQAGNTGDGLSPATAKRDIQAAVGALPPNGGIVIMSGRDHTPGSTISDQGKCVVFCGVGPMATNVIQTSAYGAAFHMQHRWSGCYRFQTGPDATVISQPGHGGIIMQEKNQWVEKVNFWRIGRDVAGGFQAEDPDAPFCIKAAGVSVNLNNAAALPPTEELSDWLRIMDCYFFTVYRAVILLQGVNGHMNGCTGDADGGAWLYAERGTSGLNTSFGFAENHMVANPAEHRAGIRDHGYIVYVRALSTQKFMGVRFNANRTESFSASDPAHYFIDSTRNGWMMCTAGGTGGQQRLIDFGASGNSAENLVGPWLKSGGPTGYQNASAVTFVPTVVGPP